MTSVNDREYQDRWYVDWKFAQQQDECAVGQHNREPDRGRARNDSGNTWRDGCKHPVHQEDETRRNGAGNHDADHGCAEVTLLQV